MKRRVDPNPIKELENVRLYLELKDIALQESRNEARRLRKERDDLQRRLEQSQAAYKWLEAAYDDLFERRES